MPEKGRKELARFPERIWAVLASDQAGAIGYVALTFRIWCQDGAWLGMCSELKVPSFGDAPGAALDNVVDATLGYLNEIEDTGERERIFDERGLTFRTDAPSPEDDEAVQEEMAIGQTVSRLDVGLTAAVG